MGAALYIDLGSPYVYLAVERLDRFDFGRVELRPVSLGAIFKQTRRSSWGLSPRREVGMAEIEARARVYGLPPIRWPEGWPSNYLRANRAALAAGEQGRLDAYVREALRMAFAEGADLGGERGYLEAARRAELDPEHVRARIEDPEIKERLRAATEAALAAGVTGVPTLELDGRLYWGDDQLEIAAA